ncbi:MAG: DUF1461 domain-containing protein [Candidatus Woesearchaeota archaeon]
MVFLVLTFAYIIIVGNARFVMFNEDIYKKMLEKHGSYSRLQNADEIIGNIFDFLKHKDELGDYGYTEKEINHMDDVRNTFDIMISLFYLFIVADLMIILVLFYYFRLNIMNLLKIFRNAAFAVIGLGTALLISSLISFYNTFVALHYLFFKPGSFMLSRTTLLKQLLPDPLFKDILMRISINVMITSFVIIILSYVLILSYRQKKIL